MHGCERESSGSQRPALDIADIIRAHGQTLRKLYPLTAGQAAALRDIERCRTAALGGHLDECKTCAWSRPSYNSCRNRHCPTCQALRQAVWIESRVARTLATHHFHVVFMRIPGAFDQRFRRDPIADFGSIRSGFPAIRSRIPVTRSRIPEGPDQDFRPPDHGFRKHPIRVSGHLITDSGRTRSRGDNGLTSARGPG